MHSPMTNTNPKLEVVAHAATILKRCFRREVLKIGECGLYLRGVNLSNVAAGDKGFLQSPNNFLGRLWIIKMGD